MPTQDTPLTAEERAAWLHLANLPFSSRLLSRLLERFDHNPQALFAASDAELDAVPGLQSRHLSPLRSPDYLPSDRQLAWYEKHETRLLHRAHPDYPPLLNQIDDPPALLFLRGTAIARDRDCIGIVGSRQATPYGKEATTQLAAELAQAGVTIVSGGAIGIDAAAHEAALKANGRTLAVLGCGLDVDYPRAHRQLFERILEQGALLTEYPLGAQPEAWRFPLRNRIISGLSLGVVVVEAPPQSGSLITARYAAEQGRLLMTVPGNINRLTSQGSNALLRDGAIPVLETNDILHAAGLVALPAPVAPQLSLGLEGATAPEKPARSAPAKPTVPAARPAPDLSENQRALLNLLSLTPRHIDTVVRDSGLSATQVGVELTLMELAGLVRRLPGNVYIRTA